MSIEFIDFNLPVSQEVIKFLLDKNISLDHLLLLGLIKSEQQDVVQRLLNSSIYKNVLLQLTTKGYIKIREGYLLTCSGDSIVAMYDFLTSESSGFVKKASEDYKDPIATILVKNSIVQSVTITSPARVNNNYDQIDKDFTDLWNNFPMSDSWINNGYKMKQTRTLRSNKNACLDKYRRILTDKKNKLLHEDIMSALKYELFIRKKNSTFQNNQLTYMQGITTWLTQRTFESYFEQYKEALKEGENINLNEFEGLSNTSSMIRRLT